MEKIKSLFIETRKWRLAYIRNGSQIEACASAIREKALLDALSVLGLSDIEIRKLEKMGFEK